MTAPLSVTTASDQLLCRIAGIGDLFAIAGEFVTGKEIPSGHINTTYKATYRKSDGTEAVSYTHLDVYKRQILFRHK